MAARIVRFPRTPRIAELEERIAKVDPCDSAASLCVRLPGLGNAPRSILRVIVRYHRPVKAPEQHRVAFVTESTRAWPLAFAFRVAKLGLAAREGGLPKCLQRIRDLGCHTQAHSALDMVGSIHRAVALLPACEIIERISAVDAC